MGRCFHLLTFGNAQDPSDEGCIYQPIGKKLFDVSQQNIRRKQFGKLIEQ
jgi:hypothetical protein